MAGALAKFGMHLRDGTPFCANLAQQTMPGNLEQMERPQEIETPERGKYLIHAATWEGVLLEIRHCPCWFSMPEDDFITQHIEIRSQDKRLLPITETGYRSHFMNGAEALAEFDNDPVTFVLWWLDEAAKDPRWKRKEVDNRQGSLF